MAWVLNFLLPKHSPFWDTQGFIYVKMSQMMNFSKSLEAWKQFLSSSSVCYANRRDKKQPWQVCRQLKLLALDHSAPPVAVMEKLTLLQNPLFRISVFCSLHIYTLTLSLSLSQTHTHILHGDFCSFMVLYCPDGLVLDPHVLGKLWTSLYTAVTFCDSDSRLDK